MEQACYDRYLSLLRRELIPAMGCTEPIALAYCAAAAWNASGAQDPAEAARVDVCVSGNIIKNVKSVIVPHTGNLRGIEAAVAAGMLSGSREKQLEVLSSLSPAQQARLPALLARRIIHVTPAHNDKVLYIEITITLQDGTVSHAILEGNHTNLTLVERNGQPIFQQEWDQPPAEKADFLTMAEILEFVNGASASDLEPTVGRQIDCNCAIARQGIEHCWGAQVGSTLLEANGSAVRVRARAYAAAGSDARMSGCEMPVIIVCGSGNQGITASVPVAVYAEELGASREQLLRAVALADLVAIHEKSGIGCLSAFCGAVCAGCGAGAAVAYLHGGGLEAISQTVTNALAIVSGMVCDGAKPSCAGKIAASVDAGLLGYEMYCRSRGFRDGDGIVDGGVEGTIANVSRMASVGMRETDRVILDIMCGIS